LNYFYFDRKGCRCDLGRKGIEREFRGFKEKVRERLNMS